MAVAASALAHALSVPRPARATPPCAACAAGGDVRGWIAPVAQRARLGLSLDEALRRSFGVLAAVNPLPASLGRICPHPCEDDCNRAALEGAVAVHALERYIGDWALRRAVGLGEPVPPRHPEWLGVIGAGPAGLSFAWQMLRRGYRVTVYEKEATPGGMLFHGIPEYRLPGRVLQGEIARLVALGLDLQLGRRVGSREEVEALLRRHAALFIGIGAGLGARLEVPGEEGEGVLTGVEYLGRVNRGESVPLVSPVVVVGGGNTAMDVARTARRTGAAVTVAYRRTRDEMPAIATEVAEAQEEGVTFHFLCGPTEVRRRGAAPEVLVVQRMVLGPQEAGRRRSVAPVAGAVEELRCGTLISAVSQVSDWSGFAEIRTALQGHDPTLQMRLWAGGDVVRPGLAAEALAQGRRAAETVHALWRGLRVPEPQAPGARIAVKPDHYPRRERVAPSTRPAAERLVQPQAETEATIAEAEFLGEVQRCFSCGNCFGCEYCFTYCNAHGFARRRPPSPGAYFAFDVQACEGCRKCVELCPCGFLQPGGPLPAHEQPAPAA